MKMKMKMETKMKMKMKMKNNIEICEYIKMKSVIG